ncbi:MAG: glutamyl-tRNA reductase [Longimicrobiales bacterium]
MDLIVLGASHVTAPAEIRDEVQMSPAEVEQFCARMRAEKDQILELSVLSTCNRTEIYSLVKDPEAADPLIRRAVAEMKGVPHLSNGKYTYLLDGREMVRHLFRVASGIESLMVGEPQILGQVRDAYKLADHSRFTGAVLTRAFNMALHAGKRARTETAIGEGTVSVAYAAVEMALKVFDGLEKHTVAVVGAGETGRLVATHMAEQHPKRLLVLNRTFDRAQELAAEFDGEARPFDALDDVLEEADVVVTATAAPEPLLQSDALARITKKRRTPLVLVDISNPRNIDPAVGKIESVFLYDLDALEGIAEQNRHRRAQEIPKVEAIIEEELDAFFDWYDALHVVPVLRAFRDRFHEVGLEEVARQSGLSDEERESLERYTRSLINKLLHSPTTRIKNVDATTVHGLRKLVAIQELFELEIDKYTDES